MESLASGLFENYEDLRGELNESRIAPGAFLKEHYRDE